MSSPGERLTVDAIVGDREQVAGLLALVDALNLRIKRLEELKAEQEEKEFCAVAYLLTRRENLSQEVQTLQRQRDQFEKSLKPLREEWTLLCAEIERKKIEGRDETVITQGMLNEAIRNATRESWSQAREILIDLLRERDWD